MWSFCSLHFMNLTGMEWGENKPEEVKLLPGWGGGGRTQPKGLGVGVGNWKWRLRWEEPYGSFSTLGRTRRQRTDIKAHTMVHTLGVMPLCLSFCRQSLHALAWVPTICHSQADHS